MSASVCLIRARAVIVTSHKVDPAPLTPLPICTTCTNHKILYIFREHSITHAKASVMLYDNDRKQWQHSGGTPGLSRVNIYHHPGNNTFRIVGRKLDDHTVSGKLNHMVILTIQSFVHLTSYPGYFEHFSMLFSKNKKFTKQKKQQKIVMSNDIGNLSFSLNSLYSQRFWQNNKRLRDLNKYHHHSIYPADFHRGAGNSKKE